MIEQMKENVQGGVSESIIENIKKTKNTSVKDLTVKVKTSEGETEKVIKNMCQVWKFIKEHYAADANLTDTITVFHKGEMVKDIHAEKKLSGKVWMVDKMQVGKHIKPKKKETGK